MARGRRSGSGRGGGRAAAVLVAASVLVTTGCGLAGKAAQPLAGASAAVPSGDSAPSSETGGGPGSTPVTGVKKHRDGTTTHTDATLGYRITVPRGYRRVTSAKELAKITAAGTQRVKASLGEKAAAQLFTDRVKFVAVSRVTGNAVNIVVAPSEGISGADLVDNADRFTGQLRSLGFRHLATAPVTVDGDPGLRLTGDFAPQPGTRVEELQLYAVHGDRVYVVTLSGTRLPRRQTDLMTRSLHFF